MKKRIIISVILFIIVIAVGAGVWWWKSKEIGIATQNITQQRKEYLAVEDEKKHPIESDEKIDTSDWKTYRNEDYKFEIKYPRDWEIHEFMAFQAGLPAGGVDCHATSEKCNVYSLSLRSLEGSLKMSSLSVVIQILNDKESFSYVDLEKRNNEWMDGYFTGCFSKIVKTNNKRFVIWNLYEVDTENGESFKDIEKACNNYTLNPLFGTIAASFILTK